jgi:transcriptional pleiotropic regulator of transition state genes
MGDSYGIRRLDELGRIVLPAGLRNELKWNTEDEISVFYESGSDSITLKRTKKYETRCVFCGKPEKALNFNGADICPECLRRIKRI